MPCEQANGAHDGEWVDAVMRMKTPVLVGDQHLEIARVGFGDLQRQAPAPVGRGEGAQQPVIGIEYGDRKAFGAFQGRAADEMQGSGERCNAQQACRCDDETGGNGAAVCFFALTAAPRRPTFGRLPQLSFDFSRCDTRYVGHRRVV